jgi:hypothetical protein
MRRQALRTQERGGDQDSAKEKNRSGPQFQVFLQRQHDHGNRYAVAADVALGALVASHKVHCIRIARPPRVADPIFGFEIGNRHQHQSRGKQDRGDEIIPTDQIQEGKSNWNS